MTLIEKEILSNGDFHYYHGIDFDLVKNHPTDGSAGFLIFLIESFIKEIKEYERNNKLKSLLNGEHFQPFDTKQMSHDFVCIYQYEGVGFSTMLNIVQTQIRQQYRTYR